VSDEPKKAKAQEEENEALREAGYELIPTTCGHPIIVGPPIRDTILLEGLPRLPLSDEEVEGC